MATPPQTNGTTPGPASPRAPTTTAPPTSQPPAPSQPAAPPVQPLSTIAPNTSAPAPGAPESTSPTKPHDARTIHLILSSLGLSSYQDRVPLQLLDLAYRYTASILGDAAHLAAEGYTVSTTDPVASTSGTGAAGSAAGGAGAGAGTGKKQKASNEGDVTLSALRLATSARLGHGFSKGLPKSQLLALAEERNRVRLPEVGRGKVMGCRLPEERFLLMGRNFDLLYDEEEEEMGEAESGEVEGGGEEDEDMGGEEGEGEFEDVFGKEAAEGEDEEMEVG